MRLDKAVELFRQHTQRYFTGAAVVLASQNRVAKTREPLVLITPGSLNRPNTPNYALVDGVNVGFYLSRVTITVDLFTQGAPVTDDNGRVVAYENNAVTDMLGFADYLNAQASVEWCSLHDVSILIDGDVLNLSGILNENNYSYRSRLTVHFYFTQEAIGYAAVLSEDSVKYPTGEKDPVTEEELYVPDDPIPTTSTTGDFKDEAEKKEEQAVIIPEFEQTESGGGSVELAETEAGYFIEAEIKEETGNE